MPRFSPDARRVLSGVGTGRVYVDGVVPAGLSSLLGGGWAWQDADVIVGNGSLDGVSWALYTYRLSSGALTQVDARGASATVGGGGRWGAYLAASRVFSYDSRGRTYYDMVAQSMSPAGTFLMSTHDNDLMYVERIDGSAYELSPVSVQTVQIGTAEVVLWWDPTAKVFRAHGATAPVAPVSGGVGARFAQQWICQWNAGINALVVYPWALGGALMGYVLSTDEKDFHYDIGWRDGLLCVCTGVNAGETAIRVYELDLTGQRFRVNAGPWKALTLVSMDAAVPVDPDPVDPDPVDPVDPDPVDPVDPDPVDPDPIDPEDPMIPLPAKCYVWLHNSNIAAVVPGQTNIELNYPAQEYNGWQEVEITKSKNDGKVLVRFTAANRLVRVDTVLAQQQHYDQCLQTYDPAAPDADSGWQNAVPAGPFLHFLGPDENHRTGIVYTLTCVDKDGKLFR